MKNFDARMLDLLTDVRQIATVTHWAGWASDEGAGLGGPESVIALDPKSIAGKQIRQDQWMRGFMAAMALAKECPYLDKPTPVAYPDGFVGFVWTQGDRRGLRLEIHTDGNYVWTQNNEQGKRTIKSDSLQDVAEAMRATFVKVWS